MCKYYKWLLFLNYIANIVQKNLKNKKKQGLFIDN